MIKKLLKFIFILLFSSIIIFAQNDIETRKNMILNILKDSNNSVISEFNKFYNQYEKVVTSFFDKKNYQSLSGHVDNLEKDLVTLNQVCSDIRFNKIKFILIDIKSELIDLISILKKHLTSGNIITLAWHLRKFKSLVPSRIKNKGDFHLLSCLRHRLHC